MGDIPECLNVFTKKNQKAHPSMELLNFTHKIKNMKINKIKIIKKIMK